MNNENAILIAGGYGVVGQQIAQVIRCRHSDIPLIIAGRNPMKAETLARELTNAQAVALDVEQANPLGKLRPRAIVAAVNDPHNHLLLDAINAGIPYLDITRWTDRVRSAIALSSKKALGSPVMLSSAWMAGVASVIAVHLSQQMHSVAQINISVLYSLKDKAGPNSAEYMDRLTTPFEVLLEGKLTRVLPYTDPREIEFSGNYTAKAYRFDTPDQLTLPKTTGALTVSARIAFDDALTTSLLVALTRSGIWKLFSGKRFESLRRALLFNPGDGAAHEIVIEVVGTDEHKKEKVLRSSVVDPKGQTHLTAVGTLLQLERLLGLDGAPPPLHGVIYPDTAPQTDSALSLLHSFGVVVTSVQA